MATQDPELRKAIADVPGGAVIFMSGNGIHLEQPSRLQQQAADQVSYPVPVAAAALPAAFQHLWFSRQSPSEAYAGLQ